MLSQRQLFDGQPSVFAAATQLQQCSGLLQRESACAVFWHRAITGLEDTQEHKCASQTKVRKFCCSRTPQMVRRSFHLWQYAQTFVYVLGILAVWLCQKGHERVRLAANRLSKCPECRLQLLMLTFTCILLPTIICKKREWHYNCITLRHIVLHLLKTMHVNKYKKYSGLTKAAAKN